MISISKEAKEEFEKIESFVGEPFYYFGIFKKIYESGKERSDKFEKFDDTISFVLHTLILEKIVLCICKLLDPPRTANKENLSLARMLEEFRPVLTADLYDQLNLKLSHMQGSTVKFRDIRNKFLSHSDRNLQLNEAPPFRVSNKEITETLDGISDWMNIIWKEIDGGQVIYNQGGNQFSEMGFERMLDWALEGRRLAEERNEF